MSLHTLCQACGLCCDGSLFGRVPLGLEEHVPEAPLGIVTNPQGGRHIPQPCAALQGTVCQRYTEERPLACRRYECLLYCALREGEVSLTEAVEVVRRGRQLVEVAAADSNLCVERDEYLSFHFGRRP